MKSKDYITVKNAIWVSLFCLPFILTEQTINNGLKFLNGYLNLPYASIAGIIVLAVAFLQSSYEAKCFILKWSAPLAGYSMYGLLCDQTWQINFSILLFLACYFGFCLYLCYDLFLKKNIKKVPEENLGLLFDEPIKTLKDKEKFERTPYATSIVNEIEKTTTTRAFNIAITGKWGSGKTSFINLMKDTMDKSSDKFIPVSYNPWDFKEEKIIGIDLLKSISHALTKEIELNDGFKKLLNSLQGVNQSPWYKILSFLVPDKEKSIQEYRKDIGQILINDNKKLVIFLDDLDRLDEKEIFEIFKTIRNSFDIANTFFVLGFDIDYVSLQMKKV